TAVAICAASVPGGHPSIWSQCRAIELGEGSRRGHSNLHTRARLMARPATLAKPFISTLKVPTGRLAGAPVKLAPYQAKFIDGAFAPGVNVGVLSVGRGNGKSTLSAALALGELLGAWSDASEREILIAAKTQQQAQIAW